MQAPRPKSNSTVEQLPRRRGRPRSPELHTAILASARTSMIEDGYDAMSIDGVAARAGVAKMTIYRRWPRKVDLAVAAIREHVSTGDSPTSSGDIWADVTAILKDIQDKLVGPDGRLVASLLVARDRHPELGEELNRILLTGPRGHLARLIDAAVQEGQVPPETDVELLVDVGPAILWDYLVLLRLLPATDLPERIVKQFMGGP